MDTGGLAALTQPWAYPRKLQAALLAEFIGMAIFQIYGGNAPDSVAAFGNGITLVVLGDKTPPPGLGAEHWLVHTRTYTWQRTCLALSNARY